MDFNVTVENGDLLIAGNDEGLFYSEDYGDSWIKYPCDIIEVRDIKIVDITIIACSNSGGIFHSTDNGVTWENHCDASLKAKSVFCLHVSGNTVYAGTENGVYTSNIDAQVGRLYDWMPSNQGLLIVNDRTPFNDPKFGTITPEPVYDRVNSFENDADDNVYAATEKGGIMVCVDDVWESSNSGLTDVNVKCIVRDDETLYAGTNDGGIFKSEDRGLNWSYVALSGKCVNKIDVNVETPNLGVSTGDLNEGMDPEPVETPKLIVSTDKGMFESVDCVTFTTYNKYEKTPGSGVSTPTGKILL